MSHMSGDSGHKDGSERWLRISATAIIGPSEEFASSFAMLFDITDRRQVQEVLIQKNEELNATYEQITASEEELKRNLDDLIKSE